MASSATEVALFLQIENIDAPSSRTGAVGLARPGFVEPMVAGIRERRTHDYAHHAVTSMFAANITTGEVISELHRRHRIVEFRNFLISIDRPSPTKPTSFQPDHSWSTMSNGSSA
jgi:hypothetical protein